MRDIIVLCLCLWLVTLYLAFDYGYEMGIDAPKVCARVPGKEVISSTADRCVYANAYGRATRTRRAM